MQVITAFGLSPSLNAADRIDQSDSIFLLLWRIFYDPLLCALQQDHQRGYCINISWLSHVHNQKEWKNYDLTVPAQAYMDDTSFLGKNCQNFQASIDIANQFYQLHDIFINGKKCDLIVINLSIPQALRLVTIGQDRTVVKTTTKEIRYLGIWISTKQSKKKWMDRLKLIVNQFLRIWNKKVLRVGHLAYIVNRVLIL